MCTKDMFIAAPFVTNTGNNPNVHVHVEYLLNKIICSTENEQIFAIHDMDDSHKHNIERKKPDTKEYTTYDSFL